MFVVYSGWNETIITTKKNERRTLRDYFTNGGRNLDYYDRVVVKDKSLIVTTRLYVK